MSAVQTIIDLLVIFLQELVFSFLICHLTGRQTACAFRRMWFGWCYNPFLFTDLTFPKDQNSPKDT